MHFLYDLLHLLTGVFRKLDNVVLSEEMGCEDDGLRRKRTATLLNLSFNCENVVRWSLEYDYRFDLILSGFEGLLCAENERYI